MPPPDEDYPHSASARYPVAARDIRFFVPPEPPIGYSDAEGDVRKFIVGNAVKQTHRSVITALAYLDVIDHRVIELRAQDDQLRVDVAGLRSDLSTMRNQLAELTDLVTSVAHLLGVFVPAWQTLKEVEEGDDMGMDVLPASELGLVVSLNELQRVPGYDHNQVISIDPPAGSLVKPGSTVTVTINVEG